jgi:ribosomal-protein-alanine N-acetyltransferase
MISPELSIETERLLIRPLVTEDVSDRYLSWLMDSEAKKWITSADCTKQLTDLRSYVEQRVSRDDVWFLGIFDKDRNLHIGNIKYEPIVASLKAAVMGVLIGDPSYRGKGVFPEVFLPTASWLQRHRKIENIYLGVDESNEMAIRAYEKSGFLPIQVSFDERQMLGNVSMAYRLPSV